MDWSISRDTPANGLPYRESLPVDFQDRTDSNIVRHSVLVYWNGIPHYELQLPMSENTKIINRSIGQSRKRKRSNNENNSIIFTSLTKTPKSAKKRRRLTMHKFNNRNNIVKTIVKTSINNTHLNTLFM